MSSLGILARRDVLGTCCDVVLGVYDTMMILHLTSVTFSYFPFIYLALCFCLRN